MKKQFGEYYLGLDIGTDSVGWAVTDVDYNLLKLNKKTMWGIRLFKKADPAATMRGYRSNRRRIARQKWRLELLQNLLGEAIAKVDPGFFWRLKESNLQEEDKKKIKAKYSLFGDHLMTDREYYDKYPTIYHLRKALMENDKEAFDIRLLYLAIAHILKHRGHFLFADLNANDIKDFRFIYQDLEEYLHSNLENFEEWTCSDVEELAAILKNKLFSMSEKKKRLEKLFNAKSKQEKALAGFLSGSSAKLSDLFVDEALTECEKDSFGFKKDNFEDVEPIIEKDLGGRMELINKLKAVYDWSLLSEVLNGKQYISQAKVGIYEEHKEDLALLKNYAKEKGCYKEIFSYVDKAVNYSSYVGSCLLSNGKPADISKKSSQEDFCASLKKILAKEYDFKTITVPTEAASPLDKLFYKINIGTAFPKLRSKDNGVIPMQVHLTELELILENAVEHFPFLAEKDANGLSIQDKILEIMKFRIPYYVGPLAGTELSKQKKRCWIVRKPEKVYPWNFDQVVDKEACAEKFIRNMTNKCTYLPTEDVLPKSSLLYTEFMARNELNNLALDGMRLPSEIINDIYESLVLHSKGKLTKTKLLKHLQKNNIVHYDRKTKAYQEELSGVDDNLQANMQSYKDFSRIFGEQYVLSHYDEIEDIIRWITLFCEEKAMLVHKIHQEYPEITEAQLKEIKRLKYSDWGRLSKTFLDSSKIAYIDDSTGEYVSIISALRKENLNLMQLLSPACYYGFAQKIQEFNNAQIAEVEKVDYAFVENMPISPAVKRSLWQSILIVQEIKKITGHDPKRIFIEVARGEAEKKRTTSRKDALLNLYKQCKKELKAFLMNYYADSAGPSIEDFINAVEQKSEADLRSNKLFLYYTQLGRCMYTGQKIDLDDLYNNNKYDKDHIYPRSKTKDDSILNNLVLVKKESNSRKTDVYPLAAEIQQKMTPFWRMLKEKGFITAEKFARLTRKTPLTNDELASFINRQLVETQQSTKAVAELLKIECANSTIVYSKAGNVSDFRHEYGFIKSRSVNDYHHAKDAYLNIVVGNVFHTRFTNNPYNFVSKEEKYTLNTKEIYKKNVERGGVVAWVAGDDGTMATVKTTMSKNNILFTKMQNVEKGVLFQKNEAQKIKENLFPLKKYLNPLKYGGYEGPTTAYFVFVESKDKKGKIIKTLEGVPRYLVDRIAKDDKVLIDFLKGDDFGLIEPRVLIKMIKINSLVKINNNKMHITGVMGNNICAVMARQLVIDAKWEKYIKQIDKIIERDEPREEVEFAMYYGVNRKDNVELYNLLLDKHKSKDYATRPSGQVKLLEKSREKFGELSVGDQCLVLSNMLKLFICKYEKVNLVPIGGGKELGRVSFNKNITKAKSAILYNQSITGIFERQIDLLKL